MQHLFLLGFLEIDHVSPQAIPYYQGQFHSLTGSIALRAAAMEAAEAVEAVEGDGGAGGPRPAGSAGPTGPRVPGAVECQQYLGENM